MPLLFHGKFCVLFPTMTTGISCHLVNTFLSFNHSSNLPWLLLSPPYHVKTCLFIDLTKFTVFTSACNFTHTCVRFNHTPENYTRVEIMSTFAHSISPTQAQHHHIVGTLINIHWLNGMNKLLVWITSVNTAGNNFAAQIFTKQKPKVLTRGPRSKRDTKWRDDFLIQTQYKYTVIFFSLCSRPIIFWTLLIRICVSLFSYQLE